MTIVERPDVEAPPLEDLDAGVIEEARARERVHRRIGALAMVVAAGFAVIALALAGGFGSPHRQVAGSNRQPTRIGSASLASCGTAKTAGKAVQGPPSQSLLSILGVLRRSATAADALPASVLKFILHTGFGPARTIFINYVRRARVISGTSYWVYPQIITFCGRSREGMADWESDGPGGGSGGGMGDAANIEQGSAYGSLGSFGHTTIQTLVPDGVATVTLHYPAGKIGGFDRNHAPAFTTTANVVATSSSSRSHAAGTASWHQ